jgi:hypothetical protein
VFTLLQVRRRVELPVALCRVRAREIAQTAQIDQYAAFIHALANDVVDKALNCVFSKDRDFQNFLKTPQAMQVASTLRVRKGPSDGAVEESAKKLVAGWRPQLLFGR